MTRPRLSYLICATPRSGSTLLGKALAATGVAGRPEEHFEVLRHSGLPREPREYFGGVEDAGLLALLPETDPGTPDATGFDARLAAAIERGTTANGIFGAKVMWGHLADLAARAGDERAGADILPALFPGARYVHVGRADKVAQAVSLWRAVQTRAWRAEDDDGERAAASYHLGGIGHLVEQLAAQDRAWQDWFARREIVPLAVTYEALTAEHEGTLRAVLAFVGAPECAVPAPPLQRQADERSAAWAKRYRDERAQPAPA